MYMIVIRCDESKIKHSILHRDDHAATHGKPLLDVNVSIFYYYRKAASAVSSQVTDASAYDYHSARCLTSDLNVRALITVKGYAHVARGQYLLCRHC